MYHAAISTLQSVCKIRLLIASFLRWDIVRIEVSNTIREIVTGSLIS